MAAWPRALVAVVLVALATGSAVLTSSLASTTARPTQVATADNAPVVLPSAQLGPTAPAIQPPQLTATSNDCVNVPIVYYHYIRVDTNPHDTLGQQLSVSPQQFQAQMDWLHQAGVHPVTLAQVWAAINGGAALPSRPIVLTFDDGHSDFATRAVPVLLREGFIATNFVVPGFLGRSSYMTYQQVVEVSNDGMVIGAHTMHHINLNAVSLQLAKIEIDASKSVLEGLTGRSVLDFAYPYGYHDPAVVSLVAQDGFRDAVVTTWGTQQCASNRYTLHRIEVAGSYNVWSFARAAGLPVPPPGWADSGLPPSRTS